MPTFMPNSQLSIALPARMLNILKRRHQVRDTPKTATKKSSSPPTMKKLAIFHFCNYDRKPHKEQEKAYCVVPPETVSIRVISRSPQTGQSTGQDAD
jgi:hypothetical protein